MLNGKVNERTSGEFCEEHRLDLWQKRSIVTHSIRMDEVLVTGVPECGENHS